MPCQVCCSANSALRMPCQVCCSANRARLLRFVCHAKYVRIPVFRRSRQVFCSANSPRCCASYTMASTLLSSPGCSSVARIVHRVDTGFAHLRAPTHSRMSTHLGSICCTGRNIRRRFSTSLASTTPGASLTACCTRGCILTPGTTLTPSTVTHTGIVFYFYVMCSALFLASFRAAVPEPLLYL